MGKVTGLELNEGMLKQAKEKLTRYPNVEIKQGNIMAMPFENNTFDGVICNQVCMQAGALLWMAHSLLVQGVLVRTHMSAFLYRLFYATNNVD